MVLVAVISVIFSHSSEVRVPPGKPPEVYNAQINGMVARCRVISAGAPLLTSFHHNVGTPPSAQAI